MPMNLLQSFPPMQKTVFDYDRYQKYNSFVLVRISPFDSGQSTDDFIVHQNIAKK